MDVDRPNPAVSAVEAATQLGGVGLPTNAERGAIAGVRRPKEVSPATPAMSGLSPASIFGALVLAKSVLPLFASYLASPVWKNASIAVAVPVTLSA